MVLVCAEMNDRCYFCGSSVDQQSAITVALISAAVAMCVISLGVATLKPEPLTLAVTGFLVLQQLALAGVDGAKSAPVYAKELGTVFTILNLSNFDVSLIRPGVRHADAFRQTGGSGYNNTAAVKHELTNLSVTGSVCVRFSFSSSSSAAASLPSRSWTSFF